MSKRNPNKTTLAESPSNGLRLEWWDANQLPANPKNWRKHPKAQSDALKGVLAEVGWAGALLYNETTGRLVDGHLRKEVAKGGKVPVLVGNWTEAQEREILATLDPIGAMAQPDMDALVKLLAEVQSANPAINALLEALANGETLPLRPGLTDDDEIPEQVETVCKTGDLWQLGQHRLLCGDATKREDVENLMAGEKADMVFTDPPYGQLQIFDKQGFVGVDSKFAKAKRYGVYEGSGNFQLAPVMEIMKDKYDKAVIWGGNFFPDILPVRNSWLCWDKTGGNQVETFFSSFELAWTNLGIPCRIFHYLWLGMMREGKKIDRIHPSEKPVALANWVLKLWTKENAIILDLFGGSGSTLIACEKLGRKCRMMEIDEHYCDVIIQRWQNFTGQQAVKL